MVKIIEANLVICKSKKKKTYLKKILFEFLTEYKYNVKDFKLKFEINGTCQGDCMICKDLQIIATANRKNKLFLSEAGALMVEFKSV